MAAFDQSHLLLLSLGGLGVGLVAAVVTQATRARLLERGRLRETQARLEIEAQMQGRLEVEDTLRRTLAMFQMLQDVTAAAGASHSLEEAIQSSLDIICSYTGWPVAHALFPVLQGREAVQLQPVAIWHLECPQDYEGFLREGEQKSLSIGKGLPGRAWSSRRVVWTRYIDDAQSTAFFRRAVAVGLIMGFAIPVFKNEELVFVLEFFSPPVPDPDETMMNALVGVGEQLGRMAERVQAQEELVKLNQRLVDLNREKNQFLGIASHDLKNPLNSLGLMGELLATGDLEPEEVTTMGQRISKEARRTSQLIQKLLDVTAIESGAFNLVLEPVSLGEALRQVQARFQAQAGEKGQVIQVEVGLEDVIVRADPEYLHEMLNNLVSNALKFMAPGPPVRTVTLALSMIGDEGCVDVSDEGPGFSEEDRERAFGRFAKLSAKPTGGESSTGLGLSIVRHLAEAMQGRVELKSQLGRGSTFRLTLPLARLGEAVDP